MHPKTENGATCKGDKAKPPNIGKEHDVDETGASKTDTTFCVESCIGDAGHTTLGTKILCEAKAGDITIYTVCLREKVTVGPEEAKLTAPVGAHFTEVEDHENSCVLSEKS